MRRRQRHKQDSIYLVIGIAIIVAVLVYFYTDNYILAIIAFFVPFFSNIIYLVIKRHRIKLKYIRSGIFDVDKMDGEDFEKFLLCHFEAQGYKGTTTPKTNDYGADLILRKDNEKIVLQAKRWTAKVGIAAVQQITGAVNYYKADKGIVITNNYFTKNAANLAEKNNVDLWDRDKLVEIMSQSTNKAITKQKHDICPLCGGAMIKKIGKYGEFYGCTNYPVCRYTEK